MYEIKAVWVIGIAGLGIVNIVIFNYYSEN